MSDDIKTPDTIEEETSEQHSQYRPFDGGNGDIVHHLAGMYRNWFLDYASYVILERAVPHLSDGLKPVQRRILHAMKSMEDGRKNKVANIVGETMKYHPHGDASIKDALVQLGQKDLLVDTQGNWGNILTGDAAAASRYIEARLTKFALDVVFNPKTTEWKLSYDGRKKEPITLPVKFPLLLAQGAEGIAVGLSSKILPHNINEICDAAIKYLQGEDFKLYPDFPTGGAIDVSRYNDGLRGGTLKVRAKIEKIDDRTIVIREIPFSKTTGTLIDSIVSAKEKGKIKIDKIEDNTAAEAEIRIHLASGVSSDKTIDALYAFTDCEISIAPNCCVIENKTPKFLTVSEVLRKTVDRTRELLQKELLIRRSELLESLHFASLEKIFIEERIYKDKAFEQAPNMDAACEHIDERLTPFYPQFIREVTKEDIIRLFEIKMARILKFNKDKADDFIMRMQAEVDRINEDLKDMVGVTINWYRLIQEKYGDLHPRHTEIRSFDSIEAAKVAEANEKLYINRQEGFVGTGLKKYEFVQNCSDIDDVILFYRDGTYKVIRIQDKVFIGETERCKKEKHKAEVIHLAVFKKGDKRTIYNAVYRDGKGGNYYMKRFYVTGVTHDREYDLTQGKPGSRVVYFTANSNGEAETIKITLKPNPKLKKIIFDRDFSELLIKGRQSMGNLLTKNDIYRISLKSHGGSTLGGRKMWFDNDVQRLNYDEHGQYLGEFSNNDLILVVLPNGQFYTTNFDINNHYETNILRIEKFDENKVWTAVLTDISQGGFPYVKRFKFERTKKPLNYLGENSSNQLLLLSDEDFPRFKVTFGGNDAYRDPIEIDAETFISVKSFKAKGKRITTLAIENIEELEPLRHKEQQRETEPNNASQEKGTPQSEDDDNGQLTLF